MVIFHKWIYYIYKRTPYVLIYSVMHMVQQLKKKKSFSVKHYLLYMSEGLSSVHKFYFELQPTHKKQNKTVATNDI